MSALLDSMAQAFCGSDARREVLDTVLRDGLPAARSEAWKYTSLRQLERRAFAAAPLSPPVLDAGVLDDIPARPHPHDPSKIPSKTSIMDRDSSLVRGS